MQNEPKCKKNQIHTCATKLHEVQVLKKNGDRLIREILETREIRQTSELCKHTVGVLVMKRGSFLARSPRKIRRDIGEEIKSAEGFPIKNSIDSAASSMSVLPFLL